MDLLHIFKLTLRSTTVATKVSRTPGNNGSIVQNRSKRIVSGLNLLHGLQLILYSA